MKILYTSTGYKPAYRLGGPVISVSAVAENLVRKGHQVTVFTTNSNLDEDLAVPLDRPVDVAGVTVWYFRRDDWVKRNLTFIPYLSRSIGYLYTPGMKAELDRLVPNVDLVHTQGPFVYPTLAAARAARRHGKPLFYHQRGAFTPERLRFRQLKKMLYIQAVERPIMRDASTLIALTEAEAESYRRLRLSTPIRVVPNGIDVEECRRGSGSDADQRWGIPAGALVILFLGRLHPTKGADKLLEAFLNIHARFPRAYLVLAGPDEWRLVAEFRKKIARASAKSRVLFPGMVSGKDKFDLLARADLFCLPSEAEGFSMGVLEALASETAVLISPGCGFPAVVTAGAGRIVAADPRPLAEALGEMLSNPEELVVMGGRGRELALREYSWEHVTQRLLEVYEEGIQRASTGNRPSR